MNVKIIFCYIKYFKRGPVGCPEVGHGHQGGPKKVWPPQEIGLIRPWPLLRQKRFYFNTQYFMTDVKINRSKQKPIIILDLFIFYALTWQDF